MALHYGDPFTLTSIYGDFLEIKTDKKPPSQYIDDSSKQLSFTSKKNDFLCMFISAGDIAIGEEILYNAPLHICIYGYNDEIGYYSDKKDNRPLYFFDKEVVLKTTEDKSDYNCTFYIKPELVDNRPSKGETDPVLYTDVISIAGRDDYTIINDCGWWGCRVMRTYDDNKDYPVSFVHGDKPSKFPTFTIFENNEQQEEYNSSNSTFSESDNIYCSCATSSSISESVDSNISYTEEETDVIAEGNVDLKEKYGYGEDFNYGCIPDYGCIPGYCIPGFCENPCSPLFNCQICWPETCIDEYCTGDLCAQAGIEFTNTLQLYFDYQILTYTKESVDAATGKASYTYEQKIILKNMYFKGKILYEETVSGIKTVSYGIALKIDVKNPTNLYCRTVTSTKNDGLSNTFACGGCILLTDEKLYIKETVKIEGQDIGFEMSLDQPIIGICATAKGNTTGSTSSGIYCNISASVYTKLIIPGVPDPALTVNAVYAYDLVNNKPV